jgi:hypothetical protein
VTDTDEEGEAVGIVAVEKNVVPTYKKRPCRNTRIFYTAGQKIKK